MDPLHLQFPALYRDLIPSVMERRVPKEVKADCANCVMAQNDPGSGQVHVFRADTKCCTYHPRLPNFLLGAILTDPRSELREGQDRLREKIRNRVGITPWFLDAPAMHAHLYKNVRSAFGKSKNFLCPFFASDSGNCSIWPYREAVCSTWFCKYSAGKDGLLFWTALKKFVGLLESQLARYALLQIDADFVLDDRAAALYQRDDLTLADLDGEAAPEDYRTLWRSFEGREEELYVRSYEIVRHLTADKVERILGLDGDIKGQDFERRYQAMISDRLPDKLQFNSSANMRWLPSGELAVAAYSDYDCIALPSSAYPLLMSFDGTRNTEEVREYIRKEYQMDFSDEIYLTLYRYRILRDAQP